MNNEELKALLTRAGELVENIRPHHDGTLDTCADPDDLLEICDVTEKLVVQVIDLKKHLIQSGILLQSQEAGKAKLHERIKELEERVARLESI